MNELIRYKVDEVGTRCAYDSQTEVELTDGIPFRILNYGSPIITNVSPNQKLTFFGLSIKVPNGASKMVKWSSNTVDSVLLIFLDEDGNPVENSFAYQLTMDNTIELEQMGDSM